MAIATVPEVTSRADSGCGGCASCQPSPKNSFTFLVQDIRQYLGDSSGIDSAHVDPDHIKALMAEYTSDEREWERHANADKSKNYTRNLVDSINGKANLVSHLEVLYGSTIVNNAADIDCVESAKGISYP